MTASTWSRSCSAPRCGPSGDHRSGHRDLRRAVGAHARDEAAHAGRHGAVRVAVAGDPRRHHPTRHHPGGLLGDWGGAGRVYVRLLDHRADLRDVALAARREDHRRCPTRHRARRQTDREHPQGRTAPSRPKSSRPPDRTASIRSRRSAWPSSRPPVGSRSSSTTRQLHHRRPERATTRPDASQTHPHELRTVGRDVGPSLGADGIAVPASQSGAGAPRSLGRPPPTDRSSGDQDWVAALSSGPRLPDVLADRGQRAVTGLVGGGPFADPEEVARRRVLGCCDTRCWDLRRAANPRRARRRRLHQLSVRTGDPGATALAVIVRIEAGAFYAALDGFGTQVRKGSARPATGQGVTTRTPSARHVVVGPPPAAVPAVPGVGPRLDVVLSPVAGSSVVPGGMVVVAVLPGDVVVVTLAATDTVAVVAGAGVVGVGTSLGSSPQPAITAARAITGSSRRRVTPQRFPGRGERQPRDHQAAVDASRGRAVRQLWRPIFMCSPGGVRCSLTWIPLRLRR